MLRFIFSAIAMAACSLPAHALGIDDLSNQETIAGLKDALSEGARAAVGQLGATDGFLGNERLRIPLPESMRSVESGLRLMGMGAQADELVTSMNRAAEMAVKEATPLLVDAVKKMSVKDAKSILTGGDDAATQYFRRSTEEALTRRFLRS